MSYSIIKKYYSPKLNVGDLKTVFSMLAEQYGIDPKSLQISAVFEIGSVGTETTDLSIDDLSKIVTFDGSPSLITISFYRKNYNPDFAIAMWESNDILSIRYHFLKNLEGKVMTILENKLSLVALSPEEIETIEKENVNKDFWSLLHPSVVGIAKSRFDSGHFADAVEASFKALNSTVKEIYKKKKGDELDGVNLMRKAFSPQNPVIVLDDLSGETGKSIQQGYMDLFAGAISGIRNPKAHGNIDIDAKRAMHHLFVASLLFYKLEERL